MPAKEYVLNYLNDLRGINNTLPDEMIPDNCLSDSRNFIPKRNGGNLIKRAGVKAQSNGDTYPADLTNYINRPSIYCGKLGTYFQECYYKSGGTLWKTRIYKISDGTVIYSNDDVALHTTTPAWATMGAYDVFMSAGYALKTSNGTTFSSLGSTAFSIIPCSYNNYLFSIGDYPTPTQLRWSNIGDPTTWGTSGYNLTFNTQYRNEILTSLRWFGQYLVLWSTARYYMIYGYGPLDFTVVYSAREDGCACHELTCVTPYGLFWWSSLHGLIWSHDGIAIDYPMLRKISATFDSLKTNTSGNGSVIWRPLERCISIYGLTSAASNESNLRIDYYPEKDAFYIHDDNGSKAISVTVDDVAGASIFANANIYHLYRDPTPSTGKLYCRTEDESIGTDLGSAIASSYIETKRISVGSLSKVKNTERMTLTTKLGTSGNVTYSNYIDNATNVVQTYTVAPATGVVDTAFGTNARVKKIKHRVSDALVGRTELYNLIEEGTIE